jgi:hypothetical protein
MMSYKLRTPTAALLAGLLALSAAEAIAAPVDLRVEGIGVEVARGDFRVLPRIGLDKLGDLADHPLQIHVLFDGMLFQALSDVVHYADDHHTCHDYSAPNCGQGECLDLYTFTAYWEGNCTTWQLYQCACTYVIEPLVEWAGFYNQQFCTVIVDPNNLVDELDETNNMMTFALGPVGTESRSWSAVKALYR